MRTSKFSEAQRRFALLAVEAGWTVTEVCRVFGITRVTFYRWKKELTLDLTPETKALLAALQAGPRYAESLEAGLEALAPPPVPTKEDLDWKIRHELNAMAGWMWQKGYRRLHQELLRRGFKVGIGRTYRLYQDQGLALRKMRKKANADGTRVGRWPKGSYGVLVDAT
jgi:hypothetical protein